MALILFIRVARGLAVGGAVLLAIGVATSVTTTLHGWPSNPSDPLDRARHLGEGISKGMHVAFLASALVLPAAIVWSLRRRR